MMPREKVFQEKCSMNVSLVNPPFFPKFSRQQRSPAVIKSGTLYYPYWLCFAAGVLKQASFSPLLVDAVADELDLPSAVAAVMQRRPPLVVVETSTPSILSDLDFCNQVKKANPETVIVLVGTHATVLFRQILEKSQGIDAIALGEYEYTVCDLAKQIDSGKSWDSIPGIACLKNRKIHITSKRPLIEDLDELPFVSEIYHEHLNLRSYYFSLARHPMVMLVSGRGCPNRCFFCLYPQTMHGRKYRYRSAENVAEELIYIKKEMPEVKEIVFEDDTFTADEDRVARICQLIIRKEIKYNWFANIRVDTRFDTLKAMRRAGLRRCAVGFESGSQHLLDTMGKGTTLEQAVTFKANCDRLGILVHGCFMVGFPGETGQSMEKTYEFARKLNCDSAQFYPLFLYPGTEAFEWADQKGYLTSKEYKTWLTEAGYHNCVYDLPGLSSDQILEFCEQAYKRYYLSKKYLLMKLKQSVTDFHEAGRNIASGFNFLRYLISRKC
jgi:radical SAM superfamily enzyme YgiQ (UPF0313 family)